MLEKQYGTKDSLETLLQNAVKECPTAETLWLMAAKEKWLHGEVGDARSILMQAFDINSKSEQIWLAAVKLEWENKELQRARLLLNKAREFASSERVCLKSILLERELNEVDVMISLLNQSISKYPSFFKFYLIGGQVYEGLSESTPSEFRNGHIEKAIEYYQNGIRACSEQSTTTPLIVSLMKLYEKVGNISKARSIIELYKLKQIKNEILWLENIRLERRHNNVKYADNLMAKALQEVPTSGILWAEDLLTCHKTKTKSKSIDALKKCDNNAIVIIAIARLFEKDNKILKARKWYNRGVTLTPDFGDGWIYYYAFEVKHSGLDHAFSNNVIKQCVAADPHHGEVWCSISKDVRNYHSDITTILKKAVEKIFVENKYIDDVSAQDSTKLGEKPSSVEDADEDS